MKLLLKAQPVEPQNSQIRSGTAPESQITITARPGQVFTVCSQQLKADAYSVLLTAYDQTKKRPHQLLLTHGQTTLHLEKTYICPTEVINQQPYNYQRVLYSQEPFLVTRQNDPKKKEQNKNTLIPPIGLPSKLSPHNLQTGGIGPDSDEDSFFKYPFRPPFVDQSGITMVLLPFLKLPPGWQHQIPGSQWHHWLMGEPDYDSGTILNIQLNGESIARLPIHSWELQELAEDLTNSRQLLQKLAYRLNGRETFIQQLLDILATAEQNPMDEESRVRIEKQLADVLEQTDHSFSLELEWFSLQAAMTPDLSIITAYNGKEKKQETSSGKVPGSSDQNQYGAPSSQSVPVRHDPEQGLIRFSDDNGKNEHQGRVGAAEQSGNHEDHGEQSQDSSGAQQNNRSDQDGAEPDPINNAPPPASGTTDAAGSSEPVTITFIGQANVGKSSLANRFLQINHFAAQLTHVSHHEDDFDLPPYIKIRALPGYGRPSLSTDSFLELDNHPIKDNEVVIMVMANEMSLEDQIELQNLLNHGHPPERVLLVYNKFDAILDGVVGRQQIETDSSRYALENSIKKELMNRQLKILEEWQRELVTDESSAHLTQSLQTLANRLKAQKEQGKPFLLFTSASDVSTYSPEQDEELIKAISNALSGQEKKTFKEQFLDIRPGKVKQFSDFISHRFSAVIEDAKAGGVAAEDVFGSLFRQLNNDFGLDPEQGCNHWLREFSKIYKTVFNEKIKEIVNGDDSRLHTLQKQFIAFYTGHILGSIWYKFIGERRQEKEIDELGQTALHRWARNGNSGWVWLWLQLHSEKAGTLLNARDINERTPLHLAVYSGNEDTVRYILEHGSNVDAKDSVDYTPLHWAAFFGRETIAEQLLQHNASLTGQHRLRITPLHVAAWSNQGAMVNKLLEWGASIDSSAYGIYPVHYAAATGSLNSLEALLAHRLNDLDVLICIICSGHSALHIAAWYGHRKTVAKLIAAGADQKQLTKDGYMAGDLAKFRGHKYLGLSVSEKDVDQQKPKAPDRTHLAIPIAIDLESMHIDQYGYSTLHRAAREGDVNRVRDILNNNKYTSTRSAMSGYTPLHVAALYGHKEIAALLLSPANREDKDVSGNTPLHLAALFNRETMIAFLLDHSCRPDATNHSGIAVLHVVSAMGSRNTLERIFESLKQCKCDCNPTVNGVTAMHIAAKYGNIEAIRLLNQVAGISLEIETASGETPLHSATHTGQVETVKWLKITGVNLAPANKKGVTPLFMAAAINSPELIELLGQEGKPEHLTKIIGLLPKRFGVASFSSDEPLSLTPLHFAALKGNLESVQALVMKCGAKLDTRSSGLTALNFASCGRHLKVVQWLIGE